MPQDTAVAAVITASGTTWAQLKTGGLPLLLSKLATANAAKANPNTPATATATGGGASGGSLAAGAYYICYTWVDAAGETTVGTSRSTQLTVGATNIPRVSIPALPTGVSFANIYLTPAGGAAGTEVLYATGVTATTFDMSYAAPTDVPGATVPAANTTGLGLDSSGFFFGGLSGHAPAEITSAAITERMNNALSGKPLSRRDYLMQPFWASAVVKAWSTALAEAVTLFVANQGTLGWSTGPGVGNALLKRTL